MCDIGQRAYARQLVAGTEGNFSCRIGAERILCTPTGRCKGLLCAEDLCVVDAEGRQLQGTRKPSSEILMHLGLYHAAPGIRAIVHAHPPHATTFAVTAEEMDLGGILPEGDIFLGEVPLISYQTPGTPEMAVGLRPHLGSARAALLANHGAVTWGADLEEAYVLMETLETVCRVVYQACLLGGPRRLSSDQRVALRQIRAHYEAARGMTRD